MIQQPRTVWAILFAIVVLLVGCNTNDYSPIYQKELPYDGTKHPIDTMFIEIYTVEKKDYEYFRKDLYSSITKWYDLNGYNSMTKSVIHSPQGEHETVEKISRDKNSLPIARDVVISSPNAETVVSLARLKRRSEGKEEWLLRHYLDPKRYLEDTSLQFYTSSERITKKSDIKADSLIILSVDKFDDKGYLLTKKPTQYSTENEFKTNFYNTFGLLDSIVSEKYKDNCVDSLLLKKHIEWYMYDLQSDDNITTMYTYHNDSLMFISDYKYAYRK